MPFISDIEVSSEKLESLCKRNEVKELSLFGSCARGEHRPDSDVDLLVEFLPNASIGLIGYSKMQRELQTIFGIKVELVTKIGLKPIVRKFVLQDIKPLYAST
jgi:predicted nucleotidyltransferase